jgi:hypothetical protein
MTTATQPATYSSAEVCRQTGLTYRQLNWWCMQRYLLPDQPNEGPGRPGRVWPQAEVDIARMMARLVLLGITPEQAARVARDPDTLERWVAAVVAAVFPG